MKIELDSLRIENFKGIKKFFVNLDGDNASIEAENGGGKTTIYDSFLWLLFGKNSEGKKDFDIVPLDENDKPLKGLVVAVEAALNINGETHFLRKEQHEKIVKKQLRGYETLCTIDEVPKKIGEFNDYISELISEDMFKLLTDLSHFNGKMHWKERREILLDIAGEIGTPEGFEALIETLNGRSIDEYKSVLQSRKKRHEKERNEINPRIDEIQKGLEGYAHLAGADNSDTLKQRDNLEKDIEKLDERKTTLRNSENYRQNKIDLINELTKKRIQREGELANDTTGVMELLREKTKLESNFADLELKITLTSNVLVKCKQSLVTATSQHEDSLRHLNNIRDEYKAASAEITDGVCSFCGRDLPEDKLAEVEEKRKAKIDEIAKRGETFKAKSQSEKKKIAELNTGINEAVEATKLLDEGLEVAKKHKDKRFAEIAELIAKNETIPPESDKAWKIFNDRIKQTEDELGEPISEQIARVENELREYSESLKMLDDTLSQADRIGKDLKRIKELEAKEKELAQKIADVEKELNDISEYETAESRKIEESVNGKFKHVKFKLFQELLNGGLEQDCVATYNGVPYSSMSTGEKIFIGIDIDNVLSKHYDISVPLFIDHAEGLTMPIEADNQTIKLFAKAGIKELTVIREGT